MPIFTAQDIIDRAAAAADMHDDFVTPAQWLAWLNVERKALHLSVARSGWILGGQVFTEVLTASSTADYLTFTVGADVVAIVGFWQVYPDGRFRPIRFSTYTDSRLQASQAVIGVLPIGPVTGEPYSVSYVENMNTGVSNAGSVGGRFHLYPRPTVGMTFVAAYIPIISDIAALTDQMSYPMGIEERMVLGMARRALRKEESDTREITEAIIEEDRKIEEFAASRVLHSVPKVRNVDREERGWSYDREIGPPETWLWL